MRPAATGFGAKLALLGIMFRMISSTPPLAIALVLAAVFGGCVLLEDKSADVQFAIDNGPLQSYVAYGVDCEFRHVQASDSVTFTAYLVDLHESGLARIGLNLTAGDFPWSEFTSAGSVEFSLPSDDDNRFTVYSDNGKQYSVPYFAASPHCQIQVRGELYDTVIGTFTCRQLKENGALDGATHDVAGEFSCSTNDL